MDALTAAPPPPERAPPAAGPGEAQAFDAALEAERAALRLLFPLPAPRPRREAAARRRSAGLAAVVLAAAAALLLWWNPAWHAEQHATAVGERRSVLLADGSTLTLDTATAVRVAWHLRSRELELLRGRARFEVAPERLRPFQVAAGQVRIRVLGTMFDAQRRQGEVRVTVLRGLVQVLGAEAPPQGWQLRAGERLRVGAGAPAAPEPVDLAMAGGWAQGRLVFDRTPLREVLAEVQRYRAAPIRLHDDGRLGRQTVSGVFETARTEQLLDLLPHTLAARVQRHPDGSVDITR